ncbi:MAG: CdaR family protein [Bacteroidota bacterium]
MKENKFTIIFFSLLFAAIVWLSVDMGNTFQTSIELPIRVEHLQQNKAIASPLPTTIRLKIQGNGWQLLNIVLSPNLRYTIDFSTLSKRDTVFTYNDLTEHINLPKEIHIFETTPETVFVQIDDKITKKVPVEPVVSTLYRDGFGIVGTMKPEPDSIVLTGARSLLNRITTWKTDAVLLKDINAPVAAIIPLQDSLRLEVERSHSTVRLTFDVQPVAEKTIENIPIEVNQLPENRSVVLIPPTLSVIIRSGVNAVAPLNEKDFNAFVDYKSILLDTSGYVHPIILGPENIKIVQQNPEKIQYVVRK